MSIVIDGTLGVSAVQDGIISESKLATGAVTDTKLTLTPNSQEIKDALNATGSAPIYACRAWVNFNGTGTVAIRASGNVSSITDNGTGDYTVNFTAAMADINYSAQVTSQWITGISNIGAAMAGTFTVNSFQILTTDYVPNLRDSSIVSAAIFR